MNKKLMLALGFTTTSLLFSMEGEAEQKKMSKYEKTVHILRSIGDCFPAEENLKNSLRDAKRLLRANEIDYATWEMNYPATFGLMKAKLAVLKRQYNDSHLPTIRASNITLLEQAYAGKKRIKQLDKEVTRASLQQASQDAGWRRNHSAVVLASSCGTVEGNPIL